MSYFNAPVRVAVFMAAMTGLVERLIRVTGRTERLRIQVVFTGQTACAVWNTFGTITTGTIKLPALNEKGTMSREQANVWVGYVIHEVWHIVFTSANVWQNFCMHGGTPGKNNINVPASPLLRMLANAVEDARIERSGMELRYAEGFRVVGKDLLAHLMVTGGMNVNPNDPAQIPWAFAVGLRGYGVKGERRLLSALDPRIATIMAEAKRRVDGIAATASATNGTQKSIDIARWILAELKALNTAPDLPEPPPPPEPPQPPEPPDDEGGDEGGDGPKRPPKGPPKEPEDRPEPDDTDADEEREPEEADDDYSDETEEGDDQWEDGEPGQDGTDVPLKVGDLVKCPDGSKGRITAIEGDDATVAPL